MRVDGRLLMRERETLGRLSCGTRVHDKHVPWDVLGRRVHAQCVTPGHADM